MKSKYIFSLLAESNSYPEDRVKDEHVDLQVQRYLT